MHAYKIHALTADTEELHLTHVLPKLAELTHQHSLCADVGIKPDIPAICWLSMWWN